MIRGVGVFTSPFPNIDIDLVKQGGTTSEIETVPTIALGGVVGSYFMVGAQFRFATTGDGATPHWLVVKTSFNLTTSKYFEVDRTMLVRGRQPFAFIPHAKDISNITATEDFDVAPAPITSADVGLVGIGVQRGWFDDGGAGQFQVV